jgi:hypothetical protein
LTAKSPYKFRPSRLAAGVGASQEQGGCLLKADAGELAVKSYVRVGAPDGLINDADQQRASKKMAAGQ